jgi:hypothetical protein
MLHDTIFTNICQIVHLHKYPITAPAESHLPGLNVILTIFVDFRRFSSIFVDFRRFSSIFVDFRRFSSIFVDFRRFLSIFVDFRRFSSIFGDFRRFSAIFGDFRQKMSFFMENSNKIISICINGSHFTQNRRYFYVFERLFLNGNIEPSNKFRFTHQQERVKSSTQIV